MNRKVPLIFIVLLGVTFQLALILPIVQAAPHTDITVAQAYSMIYSNSYPNLVIMDVRIATDYNAGHVPGAINVPVIPPSPFDFTALYTWINGPGQSHKNDEIIVYCGTGTRSNLAANILDTNGFTKVYDMLGAYPAWVSAGYPTVPTIVQTVPEVPLGTIVASASMMIGLAAFVATPRLRKHKKP